MVLCRQSIRSPLGNPVKSASALLTLVIVLMAHCHLHGQELKQTDTQPGPSKQALIDSLKTFFPLLQNKEFENASKYCALPANFKPEMLDGMIERQEISMPGIELLEKEAKFGKAAELFGLIVLRGMRSRLVLSLKIATAFCMLPIPRRQR